MLCNKFPKVNQPMPSAQFVQTLYCFIPCSITTPKTHPTLLMFSIIYHRLFISVFFLSLCILPHIDTFSNINTSKSYCFQSTIHTIRPVFFPFTPNYIANITNEWMDAHTKRKKQIPSRLLTFTYIHNSYPQRTDVPSSSACRADFFFLHSAVVSGCGCKSERQTSAKSR